MTLRIGIIALLHESNTFLTVPTTLRDFTANVLCQGPPVLDTFRGSDHEVGGFIAALEGCSDCEAVGIFAARAMPFGTITAPTWQTLLDQLLAALHAAGPLDGLLVAPHGATVAEGASDADGDWLTRVRAAVGPELPMIGTLDLHANVSSAMADACQALLGYRTNPHLDQKQRGFQAGQLMIRTLQGEVRPTQALVQLPLCVNIERQATAEPQGQRLAAAADAMMSGDARILDLSCLYGFPYADVAEMGASVLAVTDGDTTLAQTTARQLAQTWWQHRDEYVGQLISIPDAIAQAVAQRQVDPHRPVGLLDMGDNVGGGSAGDGTWILHAWRSVSEQPILAVLFDPSAVKQAATLGLGRQMQVSLGGHTDDRHGPPLDEELTVVHLSDGRYSEPEPRHGGYRDFDQGPTAVLRAERGLTVVATSRRVAPLSLHQLLSQGLQPADYAAIVIKGVHAPVTAYAPVCSRLIRVNTAGSTCADLNQFEFQHRRHPMFPWEAFGSRAEA